VKNSSASGRAAYLPSQYFELSIVISGYRPSTKTDSAVVYPY